jgi:hypothetical protein
MSLPMPTTPTMPAVSAMRPRRLVTRSLSLLAGLVFAGPLPAAEGMWTLDHLPREAMQARYGFAPDEAWVRHAMQSSLRLSNGCSGAFVSADGLVLTNHHCVAACVEQLSRAGQDRMAEGFLARRRAAELRCPEIELLRLDGIADVTDELRRATAGLDGAAFRAAQDAARARLTAGCRGAEVDTVQCELVTLYQGGAYQLYRYRRYTDVRLAWAPEASIAAFGGDPDNFNFPRYCLDAALLRAWEHGRPVAVRDFLRVRAEGAEPGEPLFVTGHPGQTERLATVAQLESLRDRIAQTALPLLSEQRGLLLQYARGGAEPARVSATELAGVENTLKVLRGQLKALSDPALMAARRAEEQALRAFVAHPPDGAAAEARDAWAQIERAQALDAALHVEYRLLERRAAFRSRYFEHARRLVRGAAERTKPDAERLREYADTELAQRERELGSSAPIDPDLERTLLGWSLAKWREALGPDDALVQRVLGRDTPDALAARLVSGTRLGDPAERLRLWRGGAAAVEASTDPFVELAREVDGAARAVRERVENEVQAVERKSQERIAAARFARTGTGVYPDATFTLRLSYGEVQGWPVRGRPVAPYTEVAGLYRRATGAAPYALPARWKAARARLDPAQRFNFVSTHDITGGNSGSPMLDRAGRLVGLVFDGNLDSLGGAYAYDERANRAVSVHPGLIVQALRTVYDAGALADELAGPAQP